jgi:hypothetical protein
MPSGGRWFWVERENNYLNLPKGEGICNMKFQGMKFMTLHFPPTLVNICVQERI